MPPNNTPANPEPADPDAEPVIMPGAQPAEAPVTPPVVEAPVAPVAPEPVAPAAPVSPVAPVTSEPAAAPAPAPTPEPSVPQPVAVTPPQATAVPQAATPPVTAPETPAPAQPIPEVTPPQPEPTPATEPAPTVATSAPEAAVPAPIPAPTTPPTPVTIAANDGLVGKFKRHKKRVLLSGVVVIIVIALFAVFSILTRATPTGTFTAMFNDSLSTKSLEQTTSRESDNTKGTVDYNLAEVKNPAISATFTTGKSPNTLDLQSYGTFTDDFVKYNKLSTGDPATDAAITPLIGKWIQTRKDGSDLPGSSTVDFGADLTPQSNLFGDWVFANLSGSDRKSIVNWAVANNVYKYDPTSVTKEKLDGKSVFVYKVTINTAKVVELNKKLAALMGLKDSDISTAVTGIQNTNGASQQVTMYAQIGSNHLVKEVVPGGSTTGTNTDTYAKFNATKLPNQPAATYTSQQFLNALQQAAINANKK